MGDTVRDRDGARDALVCVSRLTWLNFRTRRKRRGACVILSWLLALRVMVLSMVFMRRPQ